MERRVGFGEFCFDTPQLAEGSFIEWKKIFLFAGVDGDYTCFPAIDAMNSFGQNQSN
jgi:hypothetical protein